MRASCSHRILTTCSALLLGLSLADCLSAQPLPLPFNKESVWLGYSGDHSVTRRWGVHFDSGFRLMQDCNWQQWLVRPGVNYQLSRTVTISAAYAYFKTAPGGLRWQPASAPEHRLHQQISIMQPVGRLALRHRYRFEQRFLGSAWDAVAPRTWRLQNRVRYMVRTDVPLKRTHGERTLLYLGLYNEFMLRFGNAGASSFDQNRIYTGLGVRLRSPASFEVGVINQRFQPMAGGRLENNYILIASFSNTVPLNRLLGRSGRH